VGSILRTAATYRVEHVWLTGSTPSPGSPGVGKTALGTDRFLEIERTEDPFARARDDGFRVVAIELADAAQPLHTITLGDATCLVFGNEDHGIGAATLQRCDDVAYLPQLGKVGSLSVAAAASIAMYEARRQEWEQSTGD
jgi:tRNA (guanosine-2'-O-)-methyltransferase